MNKDLFQNVLMKGLILVLNAGIGFCQSVRTDDPVYFPERITAWKGSCVLIPCYEESRRHINTFLWYQNPVYDNIQNKWTGRIVYQNKDPVNKESHNVRTYWHEESGKCGIVLKDVQEGDSGIYKLRIEDKDILWMTKKNVFLTVSDSLPEFMIRPVEVGIESLKLTLSCYINYYCPGDTLSLSWAGEVEGEEKTIFPQIQESVKYNQTMRTESTLTFTPTWKDNNEKIECVLSRGNNEVSKTGPVVLNIKYSPKGVRILSKKSTTIKEGDEVPLECFAESSNPPILRYWWYKSDNKVTEDKSRYTARESGNYYCVAENEIGSSRSEAVTINVQYAPKVALKISSQEIREGYDYKLTCSVDANPQFESISWYKDQEMISAKDTDLTLSNIREQDSGLYECEARNSLGTKISSVVNVNVMYPPKNPEVVLQPIKTSYVEGTIVQLSCIINSSNPEVSQITWYKDGKLWVYEKGNDKRDNQIIINRIKEEHRGSYECEAANKIGSTRSKPVYINVLYPPKDVRVTIQAQKIKEGQKILLGCSVGRSNPAVSEYRWYKDSVLQSHRKNEIKFPAIKWMDSGNYTCEARNEIENVPSQPVTLNVHYAPVNVMLSCTPSNPMPEHTKVTLTCKAQAYPTSITYAIYKDLVLLQYSKSWVLHDVQLSDKGKYHCTATNSIGTGTSDTINIHVSYGLTSIFKYVGTALGLFFALLIFIIMAIYFKIWKKVFPFRSDDSESHFIVMKKSHPELPDNAVRPGPSADSDLDQLNYSTIQFPAQPVGGAASRAIPHDHGVIYSVVQKTPGTSKVHEYENMNTTNRTHGENPDEIQYSTIANLPRGGIVHSSTPEVQYAMLNTNTQQNIYS